jgi:hypothetical protein
MTTLKNNFSGGPSGTVITTSNSGQYGDNSFDFVYNSGSGVVQRFKDATGLDRPTAEFVMELSTGSSVPSAAPSLEWAASLGTNAEIWTRFYVKFTAVASNARDLNIFTTGVNGSNSNKSVVWILTTGSPITIGVTNARTGSGAVSNTPITAGEWHRIEVHVLMGTSGGLTEVQYYSGDNVDSITMTDSVTHSGQNYGSTSLGVVGLGQWWAYQLNTPTTYFSNWETSTDGWIGPAPFRQGLGSPSGNLTNPVAIHMV